MSGHDARNYLYLNRDGCWRGFARHGLEVGGDGSLSLAAVPRVDDPTGALASLPAPTAPAGLAVAPDGWLFYTDAVTGALSRVDPCDDKAAPAPCLPGMIGFGRGLCWNDARGVVLVADSGLNRLIALRPQTLQIAGLWGGVQPSAVPGMFSAPCAVAADPTGAFYVADRGNGRVQKFGPDGAVIPAFAENGARAGVTDPVGVASSLREGAITLFVLDAAAGEIIALNEDGSARGRFARPVPAALALWAAGGSVYVGDNGAGRIVRFTDQGEYVGQSSGSPVPTAALTSSGSQLWIHTGQAQHSAPVAASLAGGCVGRGAALGGPFRNRSLRTEQWHRVSAWTQAAGADGHLQLFTWNGTGAPAAVDLTAASPFAAPEWRPVPADVTQTLLDGAAADMLYLGMQMESDGLAAPRLSQIRVDFDIDTYLSFLPALYQRDARSREFLARWLSLFASLFDDVGSRVDLLGALFDPAATPDEDLPWLAGWIGYDLPEAWTAAKKRQALAAAFGHYGRRGTAQGLREAVHLETGVSIRVEEPLVQSSWWMLPEDAATADIAGVGSSLGQTTVLASVEPQGAVLGTTAVVEGSHVDVSDPVSALFGDLAHRFLVRLYRGARFGADTLDAVRAVIDREKPAHTRYEVCVVEPGIQLGLQARVGIDTVVGGVPEPGTPVGPGTADAVLVLGGEPPARLGEDTRLGVNTQVGAGRVVNRTFNASERG